MKDDERRLLRFKKLYIDNYGVFCGAHEFEFTHDNTMIVGPNASGKTTIFNALRNLGPVSNVEKCKSAKKAEMSVSVAISGDRDLLVKFRDLIYLSGEALFYPEYMNKLNSEILRLGLHGDVKTEFLNLSPYESPSYTSCEHLDEIPMAAGTKFLLTISKIFAVRNAIGIRLPLVFDGIYGVLDNTLFDALHAYLMRQNVQKIWVLSEAEFDRIPLADIKRYSLTV